MSANLDILVFFPLYYLFTEKNYKKLRYRHDYHFKRSLPTYHKTLTAIIPASVINLCSVRQERKY